MTDEEINEIYSSLEHGYRMLPFARAIEAAARAEQHAECVRLLREASLSSTPIIDHWYARAADWLEQQKP